MLSALAAKVSRLIVKVPLEDSNWPKLVKRDIGEFWMDDADHRREYNMAMLEEQLTAAGWRIDQMVRAGAGIYSRQHGPRFGGFFHLRYTQIA